MRFVDTLGLPDPIKRAIEWQTSSHNPKSDISCTTLIGPPIMRWLRKRYEPYLVQDYRKMLWVLHGSLIHLLLEKFGGGEKEYSEKTVKHTVMDWVVSATMDYVRHGDCLTDYKYKSVWAASDGVKDEWVAQLNVGLWLMRNDPDTAEVGAGIKKLAICIWYRDWRTSEQKNFPNEIETLMVPVWSPEKAMAYITERVALHQQVDKNGEAAPPICTDKERWLKDFAIMKNSSKRATRAGFKTREEAEAALAEFKCDYIREAVPKRCANYCSYGSNGFCPWWNPVTQTTRQTPEIAAIPIEAKDAKGDSEPRKYVQI